jgi:hypothetical protein
VNPCRDVKEKSANLAIVGNEIVTNSSTSFNSPGGKSSKSKRKNAFRNISNSDFDTVLNNYVTNLSYSKTRGLIAVGKNDRINELDRDESVFCE